MRQRLRAASQPVSRLAYGSQAARGNLARVTRRAESAPGEAGCAIIPITPSLINPPEWLPHGLCHVMCEACVL